jgi:formate hydrogenlyase transcriptional activator
MDKDIRTISGSSLRQLIRCQWPGNIRELENLIERAVILTRGTRLEVSVPDTPTRPPKTNTDALASAAEQDRVVQILGRLLDRAMMQGDTAFAGASVAMQIPVESRLAGRAEAMFEEQNAIIQTLRDTNGRVGGPDGAAARMGLKRTTLITRMKKLGIEPRRVF